MNTNDFFDADDYTPNTNYDFSLAAETPRPPVASVKPLRKTPKATDSFIRTETGKIAVNVNNMAEMLLTYDEFSNYSFCYSTFQETNLINGIPVHDHTVIEVRATLQNIFGASARISKDDANDAIEMVCARRKVNDVKDWFLSLPETNTNLLDDWLIRFAGAEDTEINRLIGRKWLIAGAARAMAPGAYIEGCLILKSEGGEGKSSLFKALCPDFSWYTDAQVDLGDQKRAAEIYRGKFIVEMGELEALRKSNISATKNFLTAQTDTYRPAYARHSRTVPRTALYGGTTNNDTFLTDTSGGTRRFWCCEVGTLDSEGLKGAMRALWREALDAYRSGESHTLSPEERAKLNEANEKYKCENPIFLFLQEHFSTWEGTKITSNELINDVLRNQKVLLQELSNHMRLLGWEKKKIRHNGASVWGYESTTPKGTK